MSEKIQVVCPGCSLLCDDILLETENNKIEHIYNTCSRGFAHFMSHNSETRLQNPSIRINGTLKNVTFDDAINKAVEYIKNAKRPLFYGLISTTCEEQKLGIELAKKIGAIVDTPGSICHVPSLVFLEENSIQIPNFKDVRDHADFVIFWGCNPSASHLRLISKYAVLARGKNTEKGKEDRFIVYIDIRKTETRSISDLFLKINPEEDHILLQTIIDGLKGEQIFEDVAGISQKDIREIISNMKSARLGVIFFGLGFVMGKNATQNLQKLKNLFVELKKLNLNFGAVPMSGHYNMVGFKKVLQENSNYKINADFKNGKDISTEDLKFHNLVISNECDVILIIGANPLSSLPFSHMKFLKDKKIIYLDPLHNLTAEIADVIIPTTFAGIENDGTAIRTDLTELKLIKTIDPPHGQITLDKILLKILEKVI
ncbi:MAG: formylmethanofuran dehydrogenase subunit B [Candidatus Hodarchaeota archaeon]